MNRLFDVAGEVTAIGGEVQIDGPDGIAYALTPGAAALTAQRLAAASVEAARQLERSPPRPRPDPASPEQAS